MDRARYTSAQSSPLSFYWCVYKSVSTSNSERTNERPNESAKNDLLNVHTRQTAELTDHTDITMQKMIRPTDRTTTDTPKHPSIFLAARPSEQTPALLFNGGPAGVRTDGQTNEQIKSVADDQPNTLCTEEFGNKREIRTRQRERGTRGRIGSFFLA
mmetsp:Transcript_45584/g.89788  ORF Transcript_45584/g.89788 Transcript_45584/m.89788 type:complete len:157 (+) Transcript_45584:1131-1601(+)